MEIHHKWIDAVILPTPKTDIIDLIHQTEQLRKSAMLEIGHKYHSAALKPFKIYLKDHEKSFSFSFLNGLHYENTTKECDIVLYSFELKEYLQSHLYHICPVTGKHHQQERRPPITETGKTLMPKGKHHS